jgi:hypothetical protein
MCSSMLTRKQQTSWMLHSSNEVIGFWQMLDYGALPMALLPQSETEMTQMLPVHLETQYAV